MTFYLKKYFIMRITFIFDMSTMCLSNFKVMHIFLSTIFKIPTETKSYTKLFDNMWYLFSAEKSDPEKPDKPYQKYLNQGCQAAKDAKDFCHQKYDALDRQKQLGVLGSICLLLLILFIIILVAICTPSAWTNSARISEDGKFVTTHTICGPIKG